MRQLFNYSPKTNKAYKFVVEQIGEPVDVFGEDVVSIRFVRGNKLEWELLDSVDQDKADGDEITPLDPLEHAMMETSDD